MAESKTNINVLNFLYAFVYAAFGLLVPLYLIYKGFDTAQIGYVLAVMPLIVIFARTTFAIIADIIGTKTIFRISGISTIAALAVYAFATTPAMFSLGKIFEGFRMSAFWAVNRTEIYRVAGDKKKASAAAFAVGIRMLGEFCARIACGFAIAVIGFFSTFVGLSFFAFAYLYHAFRIDAPKMHGKINLASLKNQILAKREIPFWHAAAIAGLSSPLDALPLFLFPVFLASRFQLSSAEIGAIIALFPISYAMGALLSTKYRIKPALAALAPLLFIVLPAIAIIYADVSLMYAIVALVGFGNGLEGYSYEHVIAKGTRNSKAISTDIALIHIPFRIMETLTYILVGWIAVSFGFFYSFAAIAGVTLIYSILSFSFLREN